MHRFYIVCAITEVVYSMHGSSTFLQVLCLTGIVPPAGYKKASFRSYTFFIRTCSATKL